MYKYWILTFFSQDYFITDPSMKVEGHFLGRFWSLPLKLKVLLPLQEAEIEFAPYFIHLEKEG